MATYYVDPTVSGTGTGTVSDPFKSWASVTWAAGNTYLQKSGTTFSGQITINSRGTSGNEITISIYGGSDKAIIDATGQTYGFYWDWGSNTAGAYINISNFEVYGSTSSLIRFWGDDTNYTNELYSSVSNCELHDGGSLSYRGTNFTVTGVEIYNTPNDGILGKGAYTTFDRVYIHDVSLVQTTGDCIESTGDNVTLRNSYLDHSNNSNKQCIITNGTNLLIEDNILIGSKAEPHTSDQHKVIYCSGDTNESVIRRNVIRSGNWGAQIKGSCEFYYNVLFDCNTEGLRIGSATSIGKVYNNVFYSVGSGVIQSTTFTTGTLDIKNNIFMNCSTIGLNSAAATEDYNLFYNNTADSSKTLGAHSLIPDPKFRSTTDFHLRSSSPCINAGTTIEGLTTDFDGRKVPYSVAPDIGAYEYRPTVGPFRW